MMPVVKRQDLLDADHGLSIRKQASLLQVSRNKKYYQPKGENPFNLYLMKLIDQQYQRTPFFGVPRMTDYLNGLGLRPINEKRVRRLYKLMDIRAIGPNPFTSKSNPDHPKFPYLLRDLDVNSPNQVWVADITYVPLRRGFMYLFAIMDLFSRFILAWDIANAMTAKWCKYVFDQCINWYPTPDLFNTDQGSQFSSDIWVYTMTDNGIKQSMDGKGRAIDNIFIERFWRSYKYEYLYLNAPGSGKELYKETETYINFYNFERGHQSLNRKTPAEVFFGQKTYFIPTKYSATLV
jgi:putative transposase